VYFHTDAVQVAGKLPMDVAQIPVSTLSISGHKFYAPKGIGVLFVRKRISLMPLVFGGGQEQALFPGTESLANIVAIGVAAQLAQAELEAHHSLLCSMQSLIAKKLLSMTGVKLTGPIDLQKRIPGHVSVLVEGGQGEALVMKSDLQGLCISSGSACHQGTIGPSHVLLALGIPYKEALGCLRITAGRNNNHAECDKALNILKDILRLPRQSTIEAR
ncbi:MAG: aminotransferase class V-fold PLP-dependent enzyme, partial [Candidatus Melainabacteria bacterium]|nr:aminotransferase class V-fold PLP-dependent enzyme [Candidatus Melainabacteria bacterium]